MVRQLAGPGVEDPHHTELSAKVLRVQSQRFQGRRRGLQEQVVHTCLVRARHRPQCFRQRKGDQKRGDRQEERAWRCEPAGGLAVWAWGTRPIFAGMSALRQVSARWTLGDMAAQGLGAALCQGRQGRQVACGQTVGDCGTRGWAIAPEERCALDHGRPPAMLSGLPEVLSALRVRWLPL